VGIQREGRIAERRRKYRKEVVRQKAIYKAKNRGTEPKNNFMRCRKRIGVFLLNAKKGSF
jgi:hypothetical protein